MHGAPGPVVVSGRLRIAFERRGDRWGHRVEWRTDEGRFVPLLETIEGSPRDEGEPSPPMQEVAVHEALGGIDVALGIGMSGRNHCSIECTPADRAHGHPADYSLAFNLAFRLRDRVPEIRSSYRLLSPAHVIRVEPGAIEIAGPAIHLCVHSEAELRTIDRGFSVVVRPPSSRLRPYTEKWSYFIGVESTIRG
jgi:hypothetical protein